LSESDSKSPVRLLQRRDDAGQILIVMRTGITEESTTCNNSAFLLYVISL